MQNTVQDGTVTQTSDYSYDAAGRLIRAQIPHHDLAYAFAGSGACGANPTAGRDGNRTSYSDAKDGGTPTTVNYCYDKADRLTSTTVASAPSNANPVAGVSLTGSDIVYDAHGNTTKLADQTMTYDGTDAHLSTSPGLENVDDYPSQVTYKRDVTGRIVERDAVTESGDQIKTRYTFAGDSQWGVLNDTGGLVAKDLSLPGSASVSIPSTGTASWSYPNLHGDSIVQANSSGTRVGARACYDPFGQPMSSTHDLGTKAADNTVADNSPGDADNAWVGQNRKLYEHQGTIATIEMGARQYVAALGRFWSLTPSREVTRGR
ncbi:MAG: repeat protein [Glaciihabitans sp.]|nr:repeat protein [Glaciihabitans sp.]